VHRTIRTVSILALGAGFALAPTTAQAEPPGFEPGAAGVGDAYYPQDGNGGYDVQHYGLDLGYDPPTDRLTGVATIKATATQNLSSFNLDLDGLTVRSVTVNRHPVSWTRDGQELVVAPAYGLRKGAGFTAVVRYDGVPQTIKEDELGVSGFLHTDDGEIVAGQPHGAATWFPVNDHPSDRAAYTFDVTVPTGLQVIANGKLVAKRELGSQTRWTWDAREPMASYLATVTTGGYDVRASKSNGVKYFDAIDSDLFTPFAQPATGSQYAVSNVANDSYKRLARTIEVPAAGATVSFKLTRDTELDWDYAFVEAHTVGADDWSTLPDMNGHTSQGTGRSCPDGWLDQHPFLRHYQTLGADGTCSPTGTTGAWWAATGAGEGYESWSVDLAAYAGKQVELSISYASDYAVQQTGLFVDDIVVSTGSGTTSFEADGDTLDGWSVPGAPEGSPGNTTDWAAGTTKLLTTTGDIAQASLNREPEIISFLAGNFGRYPFKEAGGIVTDDDRLGFALETQTRPVYAKGFFGDQASGDSVVVHELAHQWFGDSVAVDRWKDIWLNEGFATYAEWLWSEREGLGSTQEFFDFYASRPADAGFWNLTIGDPGPAQLFDGPVYDRGAMTLHALRQLVGDETFFAVLKQWAGSRAGDNVGTPEFIALAEQISGQDLGTFFSTWLYTPTKPDGIAPSAEESARSRSGTVAHLSRTMVEKRFGDRLHGK
jgi:peptidase M1-like protein/immune inhibitor InhA-like protein